MGRGFKYILTLIIVLICFQGCSRSEGESYTVLPFTLRSSESRVRSFYCNFLNSTFKLGVDELLVKGIVEAEILTKFKQKLFENPDLLYFPSTLWQMNMLDDSKQWEKSADKFTSVLKEVEVNTAMLKGEHIQSLFVSTGQFQKNSSSYKNVSTSLRKYISSCKNYSSINSTHLELLLENKVLIAASAQTGDPGYKKIAVDNTSEIIQHYFNSNYRIVGALNLDMLDVSIDDLTALDYYTLAVGAYGMIPVYLESGNPEYLQLCINIAQLFRVVYDNEDSTISALKRRRAQKKIDYLTQSLACCAQLELSDACDEPFEEPSIKIYNDLLFKLERDKKNQESSSFNDQLGSFRLFFHLFEFELGKK